MLNRNATLSLYEVVLRKPGGVDEVRFTDQHVRVGETLLIGGSSWTITKVERPDHPRDQVRDRHGA